MIKATLYQPLQQVYNAGIMHYFAIGIYVVSCLPAKEQMHVSIIVFYHPLSTVSDRFWDQYGNLIIFPYLSSTSHANLTRISAFFCA